MVVNDNRRNVCRFNHASIFNFNTIIYPSSLTGTCLISEIRISSVVLLLISAQCSQLIRHNPMITNLTHSIGTQSCRILVTKKVSKTRQNQTVLSHWTDIVTFPSISDNCSSNLSLIWVTLLKHHTCPILS